MTNVPLRKELHEENRLSWNEATKAHNSHKGDQARFFREGGSTLFPEEMELLGEITGLSLLHIQCNSGQDSLSLAQLGAVVTGVDISDEAIAFAQNLSAESGIPATFDRADVYDWLEEARQANQQFDLVFCSYGVLCWLSSVKIWAEGIASVLKPNGRFVIVDFHPLTLIFDWDWTHKFSYFSQGKPLTWQDGIGDYVAYSDGGLTPWGDETGIKNFRNPYRTHEFTWGLGEIVTALLEAGLILEVLKEYPYTNGCKIFERMREIPGRRMVPPDDVPNLPLMFAIAAHKP